MEIEPPVNGFFEFFSPNKEVDQNKPDNDHCMPEFKQTSRRDAFFSQFLCSYMSAIIPTAFVPFNLSVIVGKKLIIGEQCFINTIDGSEVIAFAFQS